MGFDFPTRDAYIYCLSHSETERYAYEFTLIHDFRILEVASWEFSVRDYGYGILETLEEYIIKTRTDDEGYRLPAIDPRWNWNTQDIKKFYYESYFPKEDFTEPIDRECAWKFIISNYELENIDEKLYKTRLIEEYRGSKVLEDFYPEEEIDLIVYPEIISAPSLRDIVLWLDSSKGLHLNTEYLGDGHWRFWVFEKPEITITGDSYIGIMNEMIDNIIAMIEAYDL